MVGQLISRGSSEDAPGHEVVPIRDNQPGSSEDQERHRGSGPVANSSHPGHPMVGNDREIDPTALEVDFTTKDVPHTSD